MTTDLANLTAEILMVLTPFLPYLVKGGKLAGKKAFEKLGEKFTEEGWEQAKGLWEKLRHKEKIVQVAETAVALPENEALQTALAEEITRALKEDPALLESVTRIISRVETGDVRRGGKVTGVRTSGDAGGLDIQSDVKTGDVSGEVTGVEYGV